MFGSVAQLGQSSVCVQGQETRVSSALSSRIFAGREVFGWTTDTDAGSNPATPNFTYAPVAQMAEHRWMTKAVIPPMRPDDGKVAARQALTGKSNQGQPLAAGSLEIEGLGSSPSRGFGLATPLTAIQSLREADICSMNRFRKGKERTTLPARRNPSSFWGHDEKLAPLLFFRSDNNSNSANAVVEESLTASETGRLTPSNLPAFGLYTVPFHEVLN